eukprot:UN25479
MYIECVDGEQKPHDFWARVVLRACVKGKNKEDIVKNSTMHIARYDISRGFRQLIKWKDIKDFLHDDKLLFEVSLDIRTTEICDSLASQSPLICSDNALK